MVLPFIHEDLHCSNEEGWSLPAVANSFFRKWVPSVLNVEIPSQRQMEIAIVKALAEEPKDSPTSTFLFDLKATNEDVIYQNPPASPPVQTLWKAAQLCVPDFEPGEIPQANSLTVRHGSPAQNLKTTDSSDESPPMLAEAETNTSKKKRGRKPGTKKWMDYEIEILLSATEEVLPAGAEMWDLVSRKCQEIKSNWARPGSACKSKFENMAFMKKPTGSAEVPIFVARAKDIKEKIAANECIGFVHANEQDDVNENSFSEPESDRSLKAARLTGGDGKLRRPVTKVAKNVAVATAMDNLGNQTKEAASDICSAIEGFTTAYNDAKSGAVTRDIKGLRDEFDAHENRLVRIKEVIEKKWNSRMVDCIGWKPLWEELAINLNRFWVLWPRILKTLLATNSSL